MRRYVAALFILFGLGLSGCWSTEPDYVVEQRPPDCDLRSKLVRRGYPENLEALFAGSCTVTRTEGMRGPDFTNWLAGSSSAIMSCETQFPVPFWTEKSPEGKITKVHFCPDFCAELFARLKEEIKQDDKCPDEAAAGAGGTMATVSDPGTVTSGFGGNSAFGFPIAGAAAAGSGGVAGVAVAGTGVAGFAAAAGTGAAPGTAGASGAAGVVGAAGTLGTAGAGGM